MKYIRTKWGIWEVLIHSRKNKFYQCKDRVGVHDYEVLKQGNTIEELCDEFVILPLDQNKRPLHHFLRTPRIDDISHFINVSHIIYGAIWTDKGLIYVAKTNDKGEFELL